MDVERHGVLARRGRGSDGQGERIQKEVFYGAARLCHLPVKVTKAVRLPRAPW